MFEEKESRWIIERKNPTGIKNSFSAWVYLYNNELCINLSPFGFGKMLDKHDLKQMLKALEIEEQRRIKV